MNSRLRTPNQQSSRLQNIQTAFLTQHFKNLAAITLKNYQYAFWLMSTRCQINPTPITPSKRTQALVFAIQTILSRQKKSIIAYLLRKQMNRTDFRIESCLRLQNFLREHTSPNLSSFFRQLKCASNQKKALKKDRYLFLLIVFSNTSRAVTSVKIDTFTTIKAFSHQQRATINKAKTLTVSHALKSYQQQLKRWSFNEMVLYDPQNEEEDQKEGVDQTEEQTVLMECYKSMVLMTLHRYLIQDKWGKYLREAWLIQIRSEERQVCQGSFLLSGIFSQKGKLIIFGGCGGSMTPQVSRPYVYSDGRQQEQVKLDYLRVLILILLIRQCM